MGFYDPEKVRIDHMGFGLVLQKVEDEEEEKKDYELNQVEEQKVI